MDMITKRTWWLIGILASVVAVWAVIYFVPWGGDDSLKIIARAGRVTDAGQSMDFKLNRKVNLVELKVVEVEAPPFVPGMLKSDVYAGEPGEEVVIWHLIPDEEAWEKRGENPDAEAENYGPIASSLPLNTLTYGRNIRGMMRPEGMSRPPNLQDGAKYEIRLKTAEGYETKVAFEAP